MPASERGKYLGPLGAVFGLSAIGGPLLGGFFVDHLTWQWAFYINVPVGVAAFVIAWMALTLPSKKATKKVDWLGVVLLSAAKLAEERAPLIAAGIDMLIDKPIAKAALIEVLCGSSLRDDNEVLVSKAA